MTRIRKSDSESGAAVVALLFLMSISIGIITAIVMVVLNNATAASSLEQGNLAYYAAESGAENALISMLRNPNYSGETMQVGDGSVVVEVNGGTITSTATVNNSVRKIQVNTVYNNNVLTVSSWREIN